MWNKQEEALELLGELGKIELNSISKVYIFKQSIGKVNLPTIPVDFAYLFFTSDNILKSGKLIVYFEKTELNANLTLEYQCYLSEKALISSSFIKLYAGVKEDLKYLKSLYEEYVDYAGKLLKEMMSTSKKGSKDETTKTGVDKWNSAVKSLEN
jgi:hypothetical protein